MRKDHVPDLNLPDLAARRHSLAVNRGQGVLMGFRASRLRQVKVPRSKVWRIKKLLRFLKNPKIRHSREGRTKVRIALNARRAARRVSEANLPEYQLLTD